MTVRIDRITVAVNDMDAMVHFYNTTFGTELRPVDPDNEFPFHVGRLGEVVLFFCPNSITQIEAVKNRQQLRIVVADVEATIYEGVASGGALLGDVHRDGAVVMGGLSDPDGNSIELIQYF